PISFFFNDPPPTAIYTLSLHDALPISGLNDALGGWRSLRPIYDPSGLLRRLRDEARGPNVRAFQKSAQLHFLEAFEDLGKLWNADRKSTRLNSSHDQISYAVFCLKKKK